MTIVIIIEKLEFLDMKERATSLNNRHNIVKALDMIVLQQLACIGHTLNLSV